MEGVMQDGQEYIVIRVGMFDFFIIYGMTEV